MRTILSDQLSGRDKLISQTVETGDIKEKIKTIPQVVKAFHEEISKAVKPVLDEDQSKLVAQAQQKQIEAAAGGPRRFTPELLLKRFLNLEAGSTSYRRGLM